MTLFTQLLDSKIFPSDNEIRSLAALSRKEYAEIKENKINDNYVMNIIFPEDNSSKILISSNNKDEYQELVRDFYRHFIKYGGSINLEQIFIDQD